jgi:two-component system, chemotaxis family, sensor kinase CheA
MAENNCIATEKVIPGNFDPELSEIHESFLIESNEVLENMGRDLIELEKRPADADVLHRIFRVAHTLKGTSAFLGFQQMTQFAHALEDVLNKLRKAELTANSEIIDVFFEAFDVLKELLRRIEKDIHEPLDLKEILAKLDVFTKGVRMAESEPCSASKPVISDPQQQADMTSPQKSVDTTIRVDVDRLDGLMNLVGELVLARNRLSQSAVHLVENYGSILEAKDIHESSQLIDSITTELQMGVMKTRMVPIGRVFNRLPRLVRELARETKKEIDLQIYGNETELDKSIIEELNDPLIHIIRNAVDHGIETPQDRCSARKPGCGTIVVNAEHEGNHIVISIEDDGRGMDPEFLKKKAVEKGILAADRTSTMSDQEAFNLVFAPGFSTVETVTNLSGRGVGMDIVRTNVAKLKGLIEIDSKVGRGTVLTLKLPLTLAIIQGLLVKSSGEVFAIPLGSVIEVVRVRSADLDTIHMQKMLRFRDSVLSVRWLSEVLGLSKLCDRSEWLCIVVVGWSEQKLGIVVDDFLGQKEIVIKSLGSVLDHVPGIGGSTILGDGRVILILDVGQFIDMKNYPESQELITGARETSFAQIRGV